MATLAPDRSAITVARYIGIDPGSLGAIATITASGGYLDAFPFEGSSLIDISRWLRAQQDDQQDMLVVLERQSTRPGQGASQVFNHGRHYGEILGILSALELRFIEVTPVSWKRFLNLLKTSKEDSRRLALQLFPSAPLARKRDEGLAEALLIAEYARRKRM